MKYDTTMMQQQVTQPRKQKRVVEKVDKYLKFEGLRVALGGHFGASGNSIMYNVYNFYKISFEMLNHNGIEKQR